MPAPIVFFDIAGPAESELGRFYERVFDWPCGQPGPFRPGNLPRLEGSLRTDPAEVVLYLGVPDIATSLTAVEAHGGTIDAPRFEVPGVVVLGLFRDPAGNRLGLIEMAGDAPIVP